MSPNSELKKNAIFQLGGNIFSERWLYALLYFFAVSVISSVLSYFAYSALISWFIAGPIGLCTASVLLTQSRSEDKLTGETVFYGFKNDLSRNFLLGLLMTLYIVLWSLLLVIPGICKAYSYSMAYFIAKDHPEYDWRQCLSESTRLMTGYKAGLFLLDLSFIGWYLLGALCFGIGALWVIPYHQQTRACFYEELRGGVSTTLS